MPGDMKGLAGSIRMIFGEKAFFAYAVSNKNEVWWFNNIASSGEPQRDELDRLDRLTLKENLLTLHKNDPWPVTDIIHATKQMEVYPIYDIPSLKHWHKGNVCLIGDAAHATAPHIGQGASLALEDTLVLAKCIRDLPGMKIAFKTFQLLRQERVQKIIRQARKIGNSKTVPNKFQQFFRDLLLPVFVKRKAKKMDWVYAYKINWEEKISMST
jgi:2-polyprenyl-6-methoxyphenol hydroxylase-like FAD-dependent oxidoreductase